MKTPEYKLRSATKDDVHFAYNLNKATMKEMVIETWGEWKEEFQHDFFVKKFVSSKYKVIMIENQNAGILSIIENKDDIKVDEIQILPEFQGKGIGTAILKKIISTPQKNIILQVLKVNNRAKKLYENLGFLLTGETQTHYLMRLKKKI